MASLKDTIFLEDDIINPFWVIRYLENNVPLKDLNSELLIRILKKMVRRVKGVKITFSKTRSARGCFVVNGYFDSDELKSIELEICSSAFKKRLSLTRKQYRFLINEIADTLCHESIHRYQYQFKDEVAESYRSGTDEQIYYGDKDEIFCYSANIAHNIYRQFGNQSLSKLQEFTPLLKFDPYLSEYYSLFYNQPEFKKVLKLVYQHLVSIEQGQLLHRPNFQH
jgi:hypothetical protein